MLLWPRAGSLSGDAAPCLDDERTTVKLCFVGTAHVNVCSTPSESTVKGLSMEVLLRFDDNFAKR